MKMNEHEYAFLTGTWVGPMKAAYNATYEFCKEFGWCNAAGELTELGRQALDQYEYQNNLK